MDFKKQLLQRVKISGGFKNNHCHIDRVSTINNENFQKSQRHLTEKWEIIKELKKNATVSGMAERMGLFIESQIEQGVKSITTFLDFDEYSQDKPFLAYSKVKAVYNNDVELKCTNQVLDGVLSKEGLKWFMYGSEVCDFVGGLPGRDAGREKNHIEVVLSRAKNLNKKTHIHIGQFQDPLCLELSYLLDLMEEYEMQDKIVAIHCLSLACKNKDVRKKYYTKMRELGLKVCTCPVAWSDSENTEVLVPFHNSISSVKELIDASVEVGIGTDNVADLMACTSNGDLYDEIITLARMCRIYDFDILAQIATKEL